MQLQVMGDVTQIVCLLCIVLHAFSAAKRIRSMMVVLAALSESVQSLSILFVVLLVLLASSAGLLLILSPQSEVLTRADYLASFMFVNAFIGAARSSFHSLDGL